MTLRLVNRCLYGSRIYSHARPDSDHDYLDIIEDDGIAEVAARCAEGQGTLRYENGPAFSFTEAFFRDRDFLYFFEDPEAQKSLCVLTVSHYEALIRANCLWVLEILFSDDRFKRFPETLRSVFVPNHDYLRAAFKFEADFAIGKGIHFLKRGLTYKAHKNFYFAHRFAVFVEQIVQHGAIVDHEEPVRRFYLAPLSAKEAVASLRAVSASIPLLAGPLSYDGMPVRVAPSWARLEVYDVRQRPPEAPILTVPGQDEITINRRAVAIPGGVLTRRILLDHKLSRTQLTVMRAFGEARVTLHRAPPTPAEAVR